MIEYFLHVGQDDGNKQRLFVVQCAAPVEDRLLQIVGLTLDGGLMPEDVAEIGSTAECYVSVEKATAPHTFRPFTMRDGSVACGDCYGTPDDHSH